MSAFACPACSRPLAPAASRADTDVLCPGCGASVAVPVEVVPPTVPPGVDVNREETSTSPGESSPTAPPSAVAGPTPRQEQPLGSYEILEEIGRGGMGVVYKARQWRLKRIVALKMILSGAHASEDELARFRTEAEAVARLQHPGIVALHAIGEHDGTPFFEMEFCGGGSLDRKLGGTPLSPREAADLVRGLAEAMQAAHDARVIHRDLKPTNVLLTEDGTPKVTDFGLAKKLDEQGRTRTGAFMGTASYAAPEQVRGEKQIGPAADVYSLGAILYEWLTGRPPFKAATTPETMMQVLTDEPPSPRTLNPAVPRDLDTIALKCLQKEEAKRYSSARGLAEDLGRHVRGEAIHARPVGALERGAKWVRRSPAVAAMAALVFAALAAGAVISTLFALAAREQAKAARREKEKADQNAERADKAATKATDEAKRAEHESDEARKARDEAEQEAERARMGRHGFMMTAAWQATRQLDLLTAETILREVPAKLRQGWECRHVRGLCRRKALTLRGHANSVRAVAYGPDGSRLVSGSLDNTLKVWDARTGRELLTLKGHADKVTAVAYSPDGSRIASGGLDRTLKVWDARNGRELLTLKGHTDLLTAVAYRPDGLRLASASDDRTVKVWDAVTGKELLTLEGHKELINAAAYSPDGSRIVSGGLDRTLKVWDARTGRELLTLTNHTSGVLAAAYSPDGSRIVSGGLDDTLKVWDAGTGLELLTLRGHLSSVTAVACSPDGLRIVSASADNRLKVWDAKTGQELLTLEGHTSGVLSATYSPDASRIASGSHDRTLKVWDTNTGQELLTLKGHTDLVNAVATSPDGGQVVSGSLDDTLKVWDVMTGQELRTLKGHGSSVHSAAYAPDGRRVVSASLDGTLKVWDVTTGQGLLTLKGHASGVGAVAYSRDGSRIASGGHDRTLKVWDAKTGQDLLTLKGHTDRVTAVAYSPDGSRIVSSGVDKTLKVWDVRSGQVFPLAGHADWVNAVAYSPDGCRIVSGSLDRTLKVWDAVTGKDLLTLKGHLSGVLSVAYSPDGCRIVSGGLDRTLKVWDAKTGQDLLTLKGHASGVRAVACSPDGCRIVSGSLDGTLKVWEAPAEGVTCTATESPEAARISHLLRARSGRDFHGAESDRTEKMDAFAAVFHLDRLLALSPEERPALLRRRSAVLAARAKGANDPRAARALARQAVADFDTIGDPKSLLLALSRHPDAPHDRLHGALLLRTGNARDAALVLRASLRHRPPDRPPIDELLLALALIKLDRRDEARRPLDAAVAWVQRGTMPPRAASVVGLRPAGPLAALAAVAQAPPDPRLNPLDPFTAHELTTLRAEAEGLLRDDRE